MSDLTRRSFLAGSTAIPFALWLERDAAARAPSPLVRHDARSPKGQALLRTYARAVGKMKEAAEGDPKGWLFQWYTHYVKDATSKADEIKRLYPKPGPWRDLAAEMWNTCHGHSPQDDHTFFLP